MDFQITSQGDVDIITLPGKMLDTLVVTEFRNDVTDIINNRKKVVFDMSNLQFVDSSGCGALISCLRKMRENDGRLKLCGVTDPVMALFNLIHINLIFEIYSNRDEAVASF